MRDSTMIGCLPAGTKILDIANIGTIVVFATSEGVFWTDGSKNSLKRLEPLHDAAPIMIDGKRL